MSDENMREVRNNVHSGQDKYVYFILAVTVAAIGYTIAQTEDLEELSYTQIPLGISLICWGISFWFGCRNREYNNSILYSNYELLKVQKGQHSEVPNHPDYEKAASDGILDAINKNNKRVENFGRGQRNMFIIGVLLFVLWRIVEILYS
ncbi:hypothetical protein HNR44_001764 [Geomicrobium halophilum]|uniref:Uncharacterized protein n=1 Tax=Geomicrobium halophilum TaxID=549000 RepID=A0A841PRJ4_9BACL|nr:hypothetical protein [Geomicrobium halophilum]MBB6449786.1 hypothetical protein [Geomicrobium halophilum]